MKKKLLHIIILFYLGFVAHGQTCPNLISPFNGETNVPVDATIIWDAAEGVPGYKIRLGTTPGGSEIAPEVSVGSGTSYIPQLGLPENTTVYVTIILDFLFIGSEDIVCTSQSFTTEDVTLPPNCTTVNVPADGATSVSVFSNISWTYAPTATGYILNLGTIPGGTDLGTTDVGNTLNFNPPDFPPNTTIYAQVIPYNENGSAAPCAEISFTTGELAALPGCTSLINPLNGAQNVPLTPLIEWNPVAGATGYRVTIGTTPDGADILDADFDSTSTFVLDFEPNLTFFVRIVPFNDAGDAIGCTQETFSTQLGCGPYLDLNTGDFVTLNPEFDFPGAFSFCENEAPLIISGPENADGYRWYQIDQFGNEDLISEARDLEIIENGNYAIEAYSLVTQFGKSLECPTYREFSVVSSEIATIENLRVINGAEGLDVTVEVSGDGDFEFAVDNSNGPYQESNEFFDLTLDNHIFYVRDKNGCGVVQETLEIDLTLDGFPKFFTPNGDNQNDYWQFVQPQDGTNVIFQSIMIFDRYGKFIKQISQDSKGWDGTYLGRPLPAGGMWFKAVDEDNRVYNGYFTLKR